MTQVLARLKRDVFLFVLTFDVVVDDVVRVQVGQAAQDLLGHPDDLELPHGSAAVQLLQHRAAFSSLHEEVDALVEEQSAVELCDVLVPKPGLEFHVGCFEVLDGDLRGQRFSCQQIISCQQICQHHHDTTPLIY